MCTVLPNPSSQGLSAFHVTPVILGFLPALPMATLSSPCSGCIPEKNDFSTEIFPFFLTGGKDRGALKEIVQPCSLASCDDGK